jgi:hypothetical protein
MAVSTEVVTVLWMRQIAFIAARKRILSIGISGKRHGVNADAFENAIVT